MILVAQIGARRHYAVPAALERAGLLTGLYTDVCMAAPWLRMLGKVLPQDCPLPGWKSLSGREPIGVPDGQVICLWSSPWAMRRHRQSMRPEGQYTRWVTQNAAFGRAVVQRGFGNAQAVYAFNGAAVEIFEAAKRSGLKCLLDMTIAPLEVVDKLLDEERQQFPDWEIGQSMPNPPDTLIARERREWELADLILCGSDYVADSLAEVGVETSKCRVVRWGYSGASTESDRSHRTAPLRVLVAGTVELRKGIPYVLQAAASLPPERFHFRCVGPLRIDSRHLHRTQHGDPHSGGCRVEFAGPVARSEMSREYQNADVLVHSSLAEGSANVCYEALAHGLPVIATPNAGAAITNGVEGFVIPIRSAEAIASSLERLARDTELRQSMGNAGRKRAATLTLTQYQDQLTQAVRSIMSDSPDVRHTTARGRTYS